MITIHTDGCCGRDGLGGYCAIVEFENTVLLIGGHAVHTTNNQMELMGPVVGLGCIVKEEDVLIISDSTYFVNGMNEGMHKWKQLGWCLKKDRPAKNIEFWKSIYHLNSLFNCKAKWIKGHSGHVLNDICDDVAQLCRDNKLTININFTNLDYLIHNYGRSIRTITEVS